MIKAICVGQATYDMTVKTKNIPIPNIRYRYDNKLGCGGGHAANIAYMLAKWGIETSFSGIIGSDNYGQEIKKELDSIRVDTRNIETSYENATEIQVNIINEQTNESTSFTLADKNVFLKKYDFDFSPDLIVTDGFEINASKNIINSYPKAISMLYADALTNNILDLCKKVHFLITTKEFAESATGIKIDYDNPNTLVQVYEKLKDKFDKTQIIITLNSKGALYCINNQIKISPALKVQVVDPNGAGEVFRAAFIYIIANGGDLEKAVKFGNIAAGLSVQKLGARPSIPTFDEVNRLYEQNY